MDVYLILALFAWIACSMFFYVDRVGGTSIGFPLESTVKQWGWLVVVLGLAATVAWALWRARRRGLKPGDRVIYRKVKHSQHPSRRAEAVYASAQGDNYSYIVPKPWTVVDLVGEDEVEVITRCGKRHLLYENDPLLHRARAWERLALWLRWHKAFPRMPRHA